MVRGKVTIKFLLFLRCLAYAGLSMQFHWESQKEALHREGKKNEQWICHLVLTVVSIDVT